MHLEETELSLFEDNMIAYIRGRQPFSVKVQIVFLALQAMGSLSPPLCHSSMKAAIDNT